MGDSSSNADRLLYLADVVCDECASDGDLAELDSILRADETSRTRYFEFCRMFFALELELQAQQADRKTRKLIPVGLSAPFFADSAFATPQTPPAGTATSPSLGFLSTACHGTANFFSQEIPFACLMSTLIVGFALVLASLITKEHYTQMPGRSVASAERSFASEGAAAESDKVDGKARAAVNEQGEVFQFVGRVTGMVDCRWADPGRTFGSSTDYLVALQDKYSLTSGLMEITYYTGAKVILQGPCTYEVDSAAGGYLSLGKLTARVEKKGAGKAVASGQWPVASESSHQPLAPSPSSNPQSPIPHLLSSPAPRPQSPAPLFAVRTPTAVVTDLGTEFGVEVDELGLTESHVLRGSVTVRLVAIDGTSAGQETILHENDSVRVEKSSDGNNRQVLAVHRGAAEPKKFVSKLPEGKLTGTLTEGLACRLRADMGVVLIGGVLQWKDVSGNGNHAKWNEWSWSQKLDVIPVKPGYSSSGFGVNHRACLSFIPTSAMLIDGAGLPSGSDPRTVVVAAELINDGSSGTAYGLIAGQGGATDQFLYLASQNTAPWLWNSSASDRGFGCKDPEIAKTLVMGYVYGGGNSSSTLFWIDDNFNAGSTAAVATSVNTAANFEIGGMLLGTVSGGFTGKIAEILIYNRALSQTEIASLTSDLSTYYFSKPKQLNMDGRKTTNSP